MLGRQLQALLKPIIRLCMRHSLGLHDVLEAAKITFIEVGEEELKRSGEKISVSRLSVITGVHRKDAEKIYRQGNFEPSSTRLSGKVISQWRRDKRFLGKSGKPRVLSEEEFSRLLHAVSAELKPGTVLFDLERIGAVQRTEIGFKLVARAYSPSNDAEEGFRMLAGDTQDLIEAVYENIKSQRKTPPNYHAKGSCDNISPSDLPKIQKWFYNACANFHDRVMQHLSKYDLDLNPKKGKEGGARFVVGIFTRGSASPNEPL